MQPHERKPSKSSPLPLAAALTSLALIFAAVVANYQKRFELSWAAVAGIYICFVLQIAEAIAPAFSFGRNFIRQTHVWAFPIIWCLPYLLYAVGTGDWGWWAPAKLLAVGVLPIVLYRVVPPRDLERFGWRDAVLAALFITIVLSHQLHGVWNVPANLDFLQRLFLLSVAAWTWNFVRPTPNFGYNASVNRSVLKAAAINFLLFALVATPVGLLIGFNAWNPRWPGVSDFCLSYLEIFLFIAVLEETFFRGFLQTLLANSLGSWWKGQLLVSCLFGLSHILHAPFPNWRYVLLASIAGWFYGSAFRQGKTLLASSLVHAMVDAVWRTWFTRP